MRSLVVFTTAVALPAALGACEEPFPEGEPREYGSFGVEVFAMLHDELLWSGTTEQGPVRASAFSTHKDDVVWALDAVASGKVDTGMLPLLEEMLPLYDDQPNGVPAAIPTLTRDTAAILDDLVADQGALEALAAMSAVVEANPEAMHSLLGALARHPIQLLDPMIDLTLELEPELTEVFRWLHRELPTLEEGYVVRSDQKTFLQRLLEARIDQTNEPVGPVTLTVRLDGRGTPVVTRLPDGSFPSPFVDHDADGQVDVDAFARPVDAAGLPIDLPTFVYAPARDETRDQLGRAIVKDAQGGSHLLYDYFDLRSSVVAYLMRDARTLLTDGLHFDLFTAFDGLLGPRAERFDEDGAYQGYVVELSPLLDLMHSMNELRRYERLVPLIRALETVAVEQEPLLRQIVVDLAKARRVFEDAPSLKADNTLLEDLHPVLWDMARHGVLRAMFAASSDPRTSNMFGGLVTKMKYTDLSPTDTESLVTWRDVDEMVFTGPTPWDVPDTTDAQRSWLHKAALLMAETTGVPVIMRFLDMVDVPEVMITDDMARFYTESIAGQAWLELGDDTLESLALQLVDEFDDLHLQAEELNLFMNHDQATVGNPIGASGKLVRQTYGKALLSMQASGSLEALRPWVERIVARGATQDFVKLFATLAAHYSETAYTTTNPAGQVVFTSHGTGFRKLEPYVVELFETTTFDEHLNDLQVYTDRATFVHEGQTLNVADELDRFLVWLLDPEAGVVMRDGTTGIASKKGGVIAKPSRLQIMIDAFDRIDQALAANPEAKAAWDRVDLLGVFLDLDDSGDQLKNPHALDVVSVMVPVLADAAAQAVTEPDWETGIATFVDDLEDAMGSRGFARLVDIMRKVRDTPRHRAFVDELIAVLFQEIPLSPDTDVMGATLRVLATTSQMRIPFDAGTRLLRFAGRVLDPAKRLVFKPLETLRAIRALDEERVTTALGQNLFVEPEVGKTPFGALGSAFESALRPTPGSTAVMSAEDLRVVFTKMRDWMRDTDKGAERLYTVIRNR
ncbi:MAG: hypothetical protein IT385_26085 [Deltaproteobacteria bacterium]|nr:hypothetical protein [Deltaproteobacteria bacterium]